MKYILLHITIMIFSMSFVQAQSWNEQIYTTYPKKIYGIDTSLIQKVNGVGEVTIINDPTDVAGLYLWLKADLSDVTYEISGTDTLITSWIDGSGNSFDFAQSTTTKKPRLRKSSINGENVIDFDGVDDELTRTDDLNINTYVSVIAIHKVDGAHGWVVSGDRTIGGIFSQGKTNEGNGKPNSGCLYMEFDRNHSGTNDRTYNVFTESSASNLTQGLWVPSTELGDDVFIQVMSFRNEVEEVFGGIYDDATWHKDSISWNYSSLNDPNRSWRVGNGERDTGNTWFNGRIAEIIVYYSPNSSNDDLMALINNYVIPKYGL